MADTKIEWATKSWNPVTGCSHAGSPGCDHCYARRMAIRLQGRFGYPERPDDPFRVTFHPERLDDPRKWRKPQRIFVCSMGDLFHNDVRNEWLQQTFYIIRQNHRHSYMLLTKRPENMRKWITNNSIDMISDYSHVWLGVTAENQEMADRRIPILLSIPAKVHWVSIEPMLESVKASWYLRERYYQIDMPKIPKLDWVVLGGETGPSARPMNPDWARSVRDQCREAGVPFFFKQMGSAWKGETPDDLMVRETP